MFLERLREFGFVTEEGIDDVVGAAPRADHDYLIFSSTDFCW